MPNPDPTRRYHRRPVPLPQAETEAQRAARIAHERRRIAEGEADIAAGRYIEGEEALAWLRACAAGEPLPEDEEARREVLGLG